MPPQGALGGALAYTAKQWRKLLPRLQNPDVPAHNNHIKSLIRPFSEDRQVWLFAHNPLDARASANLYSLVVTAQANGIQSFACLNVLFENLPASNTLEALEALQSWNVRSSLPATDRTS